MGKDLVVGWMAGGGKYWGSMVGFDDFQRDSKRIIWGPGTGERRMEF